jgi:hypothetical protein
VSFCSLHFLGFACTGGFFWVLLIQVAQTQKQTDNHRD